MNMQNLMAQAKKIQNDMERINKEIEDSTFYGENGVVKVEMSGKNKVIKITILDKEVDLDILEDMILLAVNDALDKINKVKQEKLGKYTGGMGGIF